jgi:hypothetical protein
MIVMSPRSLGLAWSCVLLLVAAHPADTAAQTPTTAGILGTWQGTSICIDKAAFPACHNEEIVYEVRPAPQSPDSVIVRADKIVGGARESMGELVFGEGPGGEWSSVFQSQRYRGRWTVRVEGSRMSGTLIDLPSGRQVRAVSLQRSTQ